MTPAKSRAARNLLGLTQERLADMADLSVWTIQEFELGRPIQSGLIETIHVALEAAGVIFVEESGEGPGVRLREAKAE
jgi:DNA-binding XRE family transcriptional regulator